MKEYFSNTSIRLAALVLLALPLFSVAPLRAADLRLVMVEQPGCVWCKRWNKEIGPIYPKTSEAEKAPLMRQQLRAPLPEGIHFNRPARFTPTFVLIADGDEVGRIEGYPGQDFFWPLLDELLAQADARPAN